MPRAKLSDEDFDPTADRGLDTANEIVDDDDDDFGEDIPVTAAGKASALRLLDLLIEKRGLQLHSQAPTPGLIEVVAKALEWPGPPNRKAARLSEAIVDHEDVDDLFLDDETMAEIVKRW